jgi:hypothetical protein
LPLTEKLLTLPASQWATLSVPYLRTQYQEFKKRHKRNKAIILLNE